MKDAAFKDGWRRVNENKRYPLCLTKVRFRNVKGFNDAFSIDFQSGLTAVCGKNGVGKSTLLKVVYDTLTNKPSSSKITDASLVQFDLLRNDISVAEVSLDSNELYYLDPSFECSKIINFISTATNFEDFLEGVESNGILSKAKNLKSVSSCIGKPYKKIEIYEIENALDDEYTFPYFKIELNDGTAYNSLNMGMGEHLCMYVLWYADWIEGNSILLLEELENCLAAYSQEKILDYLVYKLAEKKVWTILTTHSEHILNKVGLNNTRIIYRKGFNSLAVKPDDSARYLKALGISENKRGVYFVEDYFASLMLKSISNLLAPELLDERDVIGLRCDSNLEKLIKHYEPSSQPFFDLMSVFDADQSDKIKMLTGKNVGVICLPSINRNNPEEEIWNTLTTCSEAVALSLSVQIDRLDSAIDNFSLDDHHDRYYKIGQEISVSFEQLVGAVITQWMTVDEHYIASLSFVIGLKFRNTSVEKARVLTYLNNLSAHEYIERLKIKIFEFEEEKVSFIFDGVELTIS
jgi:hypothetical protein